MTFDEWARKHPAAATDLTLLLNSDPIPPDDSQGKSEAWAQQQVRFKAARLGWGNWRNNVGATPSKCPACGEPQRPVRYGLCNDSPQLNAKLKSSDVILAIPRLITPDMVDTYVAQFAAIECKRPGWRYTGTGREPAQAAWLTLVQSLGGYAKFSTGEL